MNILLSYDDNVIEQTKTLLNSIQIHNPGTNIFFCKNVLSDNSIVELVSLNDAWNNRLNYHFIDIPKQMLDCLKSTYENYSTSYWTYVLWLRLVCVLFLDVDKILMLDADLVVDGDISEMYNTELCGNVMAAVSDTDYIDNELHKKALGIPYGNTYINMGVVLIDVEAFKMKLNFDKIMRFIKERARWLEYQDNDFINQYFCGQITYLDRKYNFPSSSDDVRQFVGIRENPIIYHWSGKYKPWKHYDNEGYIYKTDIYAKYAKGVVSEHLYEIIEENVSKYEPRIRVRSRSYLEILEYYTIVVKNNGGRIDDYLKKNKYKNVVVYGNGRMGRFLAEELYYSKSDIRISYFIDRNPEREKYLNVNVYSLDEVRNRRLEIPDVIVVAISNISFERIKSVVSKSYKDVPIVHLFDLVYMWEKTL